jgi:hypothetical protein
MAPSSNRANDAAAIWQHPKRQIKKWILDNRDIGPNLVICGPIFSAFQRAEGGNCIKKGTTRPWLLKNLYYYSEG